jgi:hypothetical protein
MELEEDLKYVIMVMYGDVLDVFLKEATLVLEMLVLDQYATLNVEMA